MADPYKTLSERYKRANRYANFGATLNVMQIRGFRGINEDISFDYPITAITGMNGSGKSTIGQLALCGYKMPTTASNKRFYVRDFFPSSAADPAPFSSDASVRFYYQSDKPNDDRPLTVGRANTEWSGYKRQPEKNTSYVGFTIYIPKVERRDMSMYSSSQITLTDRREFLQGSAYVGRILDCLYDNLYFQGISHNKKTAELGVIERYGYKYSENNMGFGEGRVVYLVHLLESSPAQSLFVVEEPETSLHDNAQYELARYLVDVCLRRNHQIILTTHSSQISENLPQEARKFVYRNETGVKIFDQFSSHRVRSALSKGRSGRLLISVEDDFAEALLKEMLRRRDPTLLTAVSILPVGDKKAVFSAQALFGKANIKSIAVRDADVGPDEASSVYSLPGALPPEKEVFACDAVLDRILSDFSVDFRRILVHEPKLDHHDYVKKVAQEGQSEDAHVKICVVKWFLDAQATGWGDALLDKMISRI